MNAFNTTVDSSIDLHDGVLEESETWVSAFIDGEAGFQRRGVLDVDHVAHRLHDYQLIRASLRDVAMTAGPAETLVWHRQRFVRLWARVDAQRDDQSA